MPIDVDGDLPEQRVLEQSMRLPDGGAVTGWAACRLHGANFCDGLATDGITRLPVPLNVGRRGNLAGSDEANPVFRHLPDGDRADRFGIATVTVTRATYDAILLAHDDREAVVAVDNMLAAKLVSLPMMWEYATQQSRQRVVVVRALGLADEHSLSPNETRLRLIWVLDAGLPTPLVNCPIHDRQGRQLGVADLLDLEAGLVVEFHGAEHRRARRQTADVRKEDRLRRVGLEVIGVTGLELDDRRQIVDRLLAARRRASFQPEQERMWVARPPADDLHDHLLERAALQAQYEVVHAEPPPDIRALRGW